MTKPGNSEAEPHLRPETESENVPSLQAVDFP